MSRLRVVFAGSPELAVPSLDAIHEQHDLVAVLSSPAEGRGKEPVPVADRALGLGVPLFRPDKLDATTRQQISRLQPDILVCVAYGHIFGPKFLGLFPLGGINLHPSLLPKLRGPSPISSAILLGLTKSGITVQKLAAHMDAGDILLQEAFDLEGSETTGSLGKFCGERGAVLVSTVLQGIAQGSIEGVPQEHAEATYCSLIKKEDGLINWNEPATHIERRVRAFDPWPRAWTTFRGQTLSILSSVALAEGAEAVDPRPGSTRNPCGSGLGMDRQKRILVQTGDGVLAIARLQLHAKKALDAPAFLNGARDIVGAVLGEPS